MLLVDVSRLAFAYPNVSFPFCVICVTFKSVPVDSPVSCKSVAVAPLPGSESRRWGADGAEASDDDDDDDDSGLGSPLLLRTRLRALVAGELRALVAAASLPCRPSLCRRLPAALPGVEMGELNHEREAISLRLLCWRSS